jgi:hypothetical protein
MWTFQLSAFEQFQSIWQNVTKSRNNFNQLSTAWLILFVGCRQTERELLWILRIDQYCHQLRTRMIWIPWCRQVTCCEFAALFTVAVASCFLHGVGRRSVWCFRVRLRAFGPNAVQCAFVVLPGLSSGGSGDLFEMFVVIHDFHQCFRGESLCEVRPSDDRVWR